MYSLTKYARDLSDIAVSDNSLSLGLKLTEFAETPLTENGRDSGKIKVNICSPQSGIIKINARVRYTGKDSNLVINTRAAGCGIVDEDDNYTIFKTGMLEARVPKTGSFRIVFYYCGNPITATSLNSFFSTRRPDEYTGVCLDIAPGESCFGLGGSGTVDLMGRKEETNNTNESAAFNKIPFFVSNRGYGVFVNSYGSVKFDFASQNGSIGKRQDEI